MLGRDFADPGYILLRRKDEEIRRWGRGRGELVEGGEGLRPRPRILFVVAPFPLSNLQFFSAVLSNCGKQKHLERLDRLAGLRAARLVLLRCCFRVLSNRPGRARGHHERHY